MGLGQARGGTDMERVVSECLPELGPRRLVVAATVVEQMESLDLKFPKFDEGRLKELEKIRAQLIAEAPPAKS